MAEKNNTGLSWAQMLQEKQQEQGRDYPEIKELEEGKFVQEETDVSTSSDEAKIEDKISVYDSIDEAMFITPEQMKSGLSLSSMTTEDEKIDFSDILEDDLSTSSESQNSISDEVLNESFDARQNFEEQTHFIEEGNVSQEDISLREMDIESLEEENVNKSFAEIIPSKNEENSFLEEKPISSEFENESYKENKETEEMFKDKVEEKAQDIGEAEEEDIGIYPVRRNTPVQSHNYALLAQIASEEEVVEKHEKPKLPIHLFALFMSIIFKFDAFKKNHPEIFLKIEMCWRVSILFIITTGLVAFMFMTYVVISFPRFVRTYLDVSGIEVYDFKVSKVSSSKVEIENIRSKDGSFVISLLTLNYSFPDLINGKIKNAFLDGVQIYLDTEKPYWNMQNFYKLYATSFLSKILTIENVIIPEGNVYVSHDKELIPIQFSMSNLFYDGMLKSDIPFKTQENPYLDLSGTIALQGRENLALQLNLIQGKFLENAERSYSGVVLSKLEKDGLQDLKLNLNIKEKEETTNIRTNIQLVDSKLKGNIDFDIKNKISDVKELKKQFRVNFSDLIFEKTGRIISTNEPLVVSINQFETPSLRIRNAGAKLEGNLSCENYACSYRLAKEGNVELNQFELNMNDNVYTSTHPIVFTLVPSKEHALISQDEKGNLKFDILTKNIIFNGYINSDIYPISLELHDVAVSQTDIQNGLLFKTNGKRLRTTEYDLGPFLISITDPLAVSPAGKVELERVRFLNPKAFLKVPFALSVELRRDGNSVHLSALDKLIEMDFIGNVDILKRNFKGKVRMKPIRLEDLKLPLADIYPYFPSDVSQVSGLLALQGELDYKSPTQISGPLSLLIENVNGTYKNARVEGISTLLSLEELVPFTTQEREDVFIEKIDSPLPLRNIQMAVKLDSSSFTIEKTQADLGDIPVQIDSTQIPYDMPNPLIYLQNNRVDLKKVIGSLSIPYSIDMTGFASLNLPIYLRETGVEIQNGEIELPDVLLMAKGEKKPDFFKDSNTFKVMNSAITVNSIPQTDKVKLFVNLEDDNVVIRRRFRKIFELNLDELLRPATVRPIPNEIMMKMQMFEK